MKKSFILPLLFAAILVSQAGAQTLKVAIVQLATSETFKSLMVALAAETKATFDIEIVPAARAVYLVESKQVDIVLPRSKIKDPAKLKELKFDYASATLYSSAFVLYTSKANNIDVAELKKGNPKGYKIETNAANVGTFEFETLPSTNIEGSLKKVSSGVIDGYLYAQVSTDTALKSLGLTNIRRQYYNDSELALTIPKGGAGGAVDKLISEGLKRLKANGKFDKIMGDLVRQGKYNDWQP